jgi:hypothetical protein
MGRSMTEYLSLNATADHVMEQDRIWFEENPDCHQAIRPLHTGEFDFIGLDGIGIVAEKHTLPARPGREWITLVSALAPGVRLREPIEMPAVGVDRCRIMCGPMITDQLLRAIEIVDPKHLHRPWRQMLQTIR